MAKKTALPPSQMETRAKNKQVHPGAALAPTPRRSSAEVQQERVAKAQAKAAQEAQKRENIQRAAEFEHADMANEDVVDATPRPSFTPKPWPPPRNRKLANLTPVAEASDESHSASSFKAPGSAESISEEESIVESDPPPPAKKLKAKKIAKAAIREVDPAPAAQKKWKATSRAVEEIVPASDEEIMPVSDEEPPQKAKVKVKVRDEINSVTKKIEEDKTRKNVGDMVKPTSSQQAGGGRPTPKALSLVQPVKIRPLKREGAIADLNALGSESDKYKRLQNDDNLMR